MLMLSLPVLVLVGALGTWAAFGHGNQAPIGSPVTTSGHDNDHPGSGVLGTSTTSGGGTAAPLVAPAAPSITAHPTDPTNSTSASFTYTDTSSISRFECALDSTSSYSTCGTTKPGTKAYTNLGSGSHTFRVRAVLTGAGGGTSAPAAFTWTIDRTAPRVLSINRTDPSPTNASSVHWTVTFSEPVTGVGTPSATTNFSLQVSGIAGSPAISGAAGSGATYTVTASTGSGTPTGGSEQLRLTSAGSIKDLAGNALTGIPVNGQSYVVDKTPPPAPVIALHPVANDNSTSTMFFSFDGDSGASLLCSLDNAAAFAPCSALRFYTNLAQGTHTFRVEARDGAGNISGVTSWTWVVDTVAPTVQIDSKPSNPDTNVSPQFTFHGTDTGSGIDHYRCRLDNAQFQNCTSAKAYTNLSLASHTFHVEAVDKAGNTSADAPYTWVIQANNNGQPYTIGAAINGSLGPNGPALPIDLIFTSTNVGNGGTQIANVDVQIGSITDPGGHEISELNTSAGNGTGTCKTSNYSIAQFSGAYPFYIQSGTSDFDGSHSAQSLAFTDKSKWPSIRMTDSGNQNACKGATIHLILKGHA
jgi:hypothetical protein